MKEIRLGRFVWDAGRERLNRLKHGVGFETASKAFDDPGRKIYVDARHSQAEQRWFCIGKADGRILTVRFVHRDGRIRIFGAGYWRKGRDYYEKED